MVKRALTLLTSILIALPLLMPFNIFAAGYVVTGSDVVIGVNADIYDYDKSYYVQLSQLRSGGNGSNQWLADNNIGYQDFGIFKYEFILNKEYLGNIRIKVTFPSGTSQTFRFYVNGDRFYWFTRYDPSQNQDMATSFEVTSVSLVEKEDNQMSSTDLTNFLNELIANQEELIVSTADIYDETVIIGNNTITMNRVLSEFYEYVSVYQKQSLETIIANIDYISRIREWNIPIESMTFVLFMLNNYEPEEFGVNDISYLTNYPVFVVPTQGVIYETYGANNGDFYIIFLASGNIASLNALKSAIGFTRDDIEFTEYKYFARGRYWSNSTYYLIKAKLHTTTNDRFSIINIRDNNMRFIPIYFGRDISLRISTDFALQYELNNRLLVDLDKIANGTVQSNSAAQSSDSANELLQTDSNTLFQQENGFKSDMQNAMQNVNNTFRLQDMGSKFVSSAQWVRTQYENLTNNTPFASLITFSLITGLALILLGKVYK